MVTPSQAQIFLAF
uniref:Uncharacterized protein n=1 Tax=Anguilla anguilla TaxID=7936 RepID=A0A0E9PAP9_ANGAN